jgi:hypothetical protein
MPLPSLPLCSIGPDSIVDRFLEHHAWLRTFLAEVTGSFIKEICIAARIS